MFKMVGPPGATHGSTAQVSLLGNLIIWAYIRSLFYDWPGIIAYLLANATAPLPLLARYHSAAIDRGLGTFGISGLNFCHRIKRTDCP